MIRCHLKDLKATKIAREGETPTGPQTTPAEWATALLDKPCVLHRKRRELPYVAEALEHRFVQPSLEDVDLGFVGRQGDHHRPVHRAIAVLSPGDPLHTRVVNDGRWELLNKGDVVVGRLAKSFKPPAGTRCRSATVLAVVGWSREASKPEYRNGMKCDAWEVIVPELIFEPDRQLAS